MTRKCIVMTEDGPCTEIDVDTDDEARDAAERFARSQGCSGNVEVWDKKHDVLVVLFRI